MLGNKSETYKKWKSEGIRYQEMPKVLDVINLGSTCDANDIDYSLWEEVGFNLASAPQDMYYDQQLLEQFGTRVKLGGIVLISISEFTFLCDRYNIEDHNYKYYWYLDSKRIINYSKRTDKYLKRFPGVLNCKYIKQEIKAVLNHIIQHKGNKDKTDAISMAKKVMSNWKCEFGWNDGFILTDRQRMTIQKCWEIFNGDIDFCFSHGLIPVVIIPPFEEHLQALMPNNILDECLWEYIERIKEKGITVINFWKDEDLTKSELFDTPICLNKKGKQVYNARLQNIVHYINQSKEKEA